MDNMSGKKVRCVKGWRRVGLRRGEVYTIAVRLESLFLPGGTVGLPEGRHSAEGPRGASEVSVPATGGIAPFKKPQFIIKELGYPYLLDADRFELLA